MASKRIVTYKCPFCDKRFVRVDLVNHVGDEHEDELPADFTPLRYVFNYVNKKPLSYHGRCTECHGDTDWDENKGRYNRQCNKKACKDSYLRKYEENMMKTRGVTRISKTAQGQAKMLANRKISGEYKFKDGGVKTYTGSYELKALEFMDKVMNISSDDIMAPGPILEYTYEKKTHLYITDFYYQPYNLIIEVKDGGDNPNKRNMPEYRAKQIAKENFIIKHTNFNYLRLTNNDLSQLMAVFSDLKYQLIENTGDRVIHVNENSSEDNPIREMMNALMSGKVPGMRDSDAYIVNNLANNVFSAATGYYDKFDKIIGPDESNHLKVNENTDIAYIGIYKLPMTKSEMFTKLAPYINKEVDSKFIYETLVGKKLYTNDQIRFDGLEKIDIQSESSLINDIEEYITYDPNSYESIIESAMEGVKNING